MIVPLMHRIKSQLVHLVVLTMVSSLSLGFFWPWGKKEEKQPEQRKSSVTRQAGTTAALREVNVPPAQVSRQAGALSRVNGARRPDSPGPVTSKMAVNPQAAAAEKALKVIPIPAAQPLRQDPYNVGDFPVYELTKPISAGLVGFAEPQIRRMTPVEPIQVTNALRARPVPGTNTVPALAVQKAIEVVNLPQIRTELTQLIERTRALQSQVREDRAEVQSILARTQIHQQILDNLAQQAVEQPKGAVDQAMAVEKLKLIAQQAQASRAELERIQAHTVQLPESPRNREVS